MHNEKSCGCILLKDGNALLICSLDNDNEQFWSFPKGHQNHGETNIETALRETKEEVGLEAKIIDTNPIKTGHKIHNGYKEILLYLAEPLNHEITPQEGEVVIAKWVPIKEVGQYLTEHYRKVGKDLLERLSLTD